MNLNSGIPRVMKKVFWDRLGITFSSACAVHCVIVAFLPLFFPVLKTLAHASWIHVVVATIILFTSPLAFFPGYRKHGMTWIMTTALVGLMLVFMGILLEDKVSDQISHGISICGSLFLVFAHAKNLQHSHRKTHQKGQPQQCC
jgi:hypothetical protein